MTEEHQNCFIENGKTSGGWSLGRRGNIFFCLRKIFSICVLCGPIINILIFLVVMNLGTWN